MPIELSHLMQLALNQKPELAVGDLPRQAAKYLSAHPAVVFLRRAEFQKIAGKHTEIDVTHFQTLFLAIANGDYFSDPNRPNTVTIFYRDPKTHKLFLVGLKCTAAGSEVWISTYHRIDDKKADRKRRRLKQLPR